MEDSSKVSKAREFKMSKEEDKKFNCPLCHHTKCYILFTDKVVCAGCKQIIDVKDITNEEVRRYRERRRFR
mgnify:CR=1 FL=1